MKYINCVVFPLIFVLVLFMGSCDVCQDCDPVDAQDPGIFISLYDETSIAKVLNYLKEDSAQLNSLNIQLNLINKKLEDTETDDPENPQLRKERDSVNAIIKAKVTLITDEKKLLKDLMEGQTTIDSLFVEGSPEPTSFSFRRNKIFRFPLRPDSDITKFIIYFNSRQDTISFHYQTELRVIDSRIKVKAINLENGHHTFQKLELDTTNIVNETHAKVYY